MVWSVFLLYRSGARSFWGFGLICKHCTDFSFRFQFHCNGRISQNHFPKQLIVLPF